MAYQEVSRVKMTELIRRWQAGSTIRGFARTTGLSRNSVKKYNQTTELRGLTRTGTPPTEDQVVSLIRINVIGRRPTAIPAEGVLGLWADQIHRWLKEDKLQVTRIQELLLGHHFDIAYTTLRR